MNTMERTKWKTNALAVIEPAEHPLFKDAFPQMECQEGRYCVRFARRLEDRVRIWRPGQDGRAGPSLRGCRDYGDQHQRLSGVVDGADDLLNEASRLGEAVEGSYLVDIGFTVARRSGRVKADGLSRDSSAALRARRRGL